MTYAAYLRIYQPVAAFHEPDRSRWASYTASSARPRRRDSLAAEQAEVLRRVIAATGIVLPDQESEHPYSLVGLDHGGLVQVLSDDALSSDHSAAEIAAAIDGVAKGERELAMYQRAQSRWRAVAEYEMAN